MVDFPYGGAYHSEGQLSKRIFFATIGEMAGLSIGTSGWSYNHWRGLFYPMSLPKGEWLGYYSQHFTTVEVNSTFYYLPKEEVVKSWVQSTPKNFIFAIKANRFITHLKRLQKLEGSLEKFLIVTSWFGEKLGPLLFQLSPGFEKDLKRLDRFLKTLYLQIPFFAESIKELSAVGRLSNSRGRAGYPVDVKHLSGMNISATSTSPVWKPFQIVFEFRHPSWFCDEVYEILGKFKAALCIADTPYYPYFEEITADFVYLRLHGHKKLYASDYSQEQLLDYVVKIKAWQKEGKDVYCYFDNDANAYAAQNARQLKDLLLECSRYPTQILSTK